MTTIRAQFYDGKTSQRTPVEIHFEPGDQLRISGLERDLIYGLSEVKITARVGNTPRSIYLPGDKMCETSENDAIDAILRRLGQGGWQSVVYLLESRWRYVLLLLLTTIVGVLWLVQYGVPIMAKRVAYALPESVDSALGRDGLKLLDQALFSPSVLGKERQDHLRDVFDAMARELADGHTFRLEFRKSERVGPNAFALPSGIIVVTDEMIVLTQNQNELVGVLAHEIGHVKHRHALRSLLQNSVVALLIASTTSDLTALTALSAALPTLLVEARYSQIFETEADQFALRYLLDHNVSPVSFANVLVRLEEETGGGNDVHTYLASHPPTSQRIHMFREER